jgi:hypothetical protein
MHDSPPPPLFKFLCALTILQTRQSGNQQRTLGPGTALKELLGEYFPTRISQGAAALAGLSSAPTSFTSAAFTSDTEALAALFDQVSDAGTGRIEKGNLDGFTPDEAWLGPARRTSRGFQWDLQRDLLTKQMVEELPKGHPEKARWKRGRVDFDAGNPVEIRSRILSTVANESSVAALKAWFTMKGGFHPCLKGRLELIQGANPKLELKITCARQDQAAFGLLRRKVSGQGFKTERFKVLLGDENVPKRVCLSLSGTPDPGMIRAGWNVFRAWIEAFQLPFEKPDAAANRCAWRENRKVKHFGITDPYIAFFVAKYENRIPWSSGRITSEKTLVNELRRILLPALRKNIKDSLDPAHYRGLLEDADDYAERGDPFSSAVEELYLAYDLYGPARVEKAELKLLRCLLAEKDRQTSLWYSYLRSDNPIYRVSPAFQYMVLDFVAKDSPAGRVDPPVRLNAEALALLHRGIVDGTVRTTDNLLKTYKALRESAESGDHLTEPARWLVFEGKNWQEEAKILAAESEGSGWCVRDEFFAIDYLRSYSSFHVLKINGRAIVALVVLDDAIVDCQGPRNEDPSEHWPRALLYSAVRRLPFHCDGDFSNARGNAARDSVEQRKLLVGKLDAAALASRLLATPHDVQFVSAQQIADTGCKEAIAAAWRVIIDEYPAAAAIAPEGFGRDVKLHEQLRRKVSRQKTNPGTFQWVL